MYELPTHVTIERFQWGAQFNVNLTAEVLPCMDIGELADICRYAVTDAAFVTAHRFSYYMVLLK